MLGLEELLSRREISENKAEIAFFGDKVTIARSELTFWKEKTDWYQGDELEHIAFSVQDMDKAMNLFLNKNVKITIEPYSLQG